MLHTEWGALVHDDFPAVAGGDGRANRDYMTGWIGQEKLSPQAVSGEGWLVDGWRQLEALAFLPTQVRAFTQSLADTMLAGQHTGVFYAARHGRLGALLPMARARGRFARWRLIGAAEVYEPTDVLALGPGAAAALAQALAGQRRVVELDRVPAGSLIAPALMNAMKGRGWVTMRPAMPCPTIALDASWADPFSHFNAGRRSDFRRAQRRAGELGAVTYEIHAPTPEQLGPLLDAAVAVELHGWKAKAGSALGVAPDKHAFFRAFFADAAARGDMRVAFMRIDGMAVAMQLAVEWQGRFWLFKIGYDERFARCSPGSLLMLHTIADAAARGLAAYEMLGTAESWLAHWTTATHETVRIRAYPFSLRGLVAVAQDGGAWLRERLRRR